MSNYDDWKLATPPESEYCDICETRLTKYEEVICEDCEKQQKDEEE